MTVDFSNSQNENRIPAFLAPLSVAEKALLSEFSKDKLKQASPVRNRRVRAEFLEWLISYHLPAMKTVGRTILMQKVAVIGSLDLSAATIAFDLIFRDCDFRIGLNFRRIRAKSIKFERTILGSVDCVSSFFDGTLGFEECHVDGYINTYASRITGDVELLESTLSWPGHGAWNCNNLACQGTFRLHSSTIDGTVALNNASIGSDLEIDGCSITGQDNAFLAEGIRIAGRCFFRNDTKIRGAIRFFSAQIGGDFNCRALTVSAGGAEFAVDLRRSRIQGSVLMLSGFTANGPTTLYGSQIGADLQIINAVLSAPGRLALDVRFASAKGRVTLEGCRVSGDVHCYGLSVQEELQLRTTMFEGPHSESRIPVDFRRMKVSGGIFIDQGTRFEARYNLYGSSIGGMLRIENADFGAGILANMLHAASVSCLETTVTGSVEINDAVISNELQVIGSTVHSESRVALGLARTRIGRLLLAPSTTFRGAIVLWNAYVDQAIDLDRTKLERGAEPMVFDGRYLRCQGRLHWAPELLDADSTVFLNNAKVGVLDDDTGSWPNTISLEGFEYDRFPSVKAANVELRKTWLDRDPSYRSQPFEHLASLYRKMGNEAAASQIAMHKWKSRRRKLPLTGARYVWDLFLDTAYGYGHRPWRPLLALFSVIALGYLVFDWARENHAFCPADALKANEVCTAAAQYPTFSPAAFTMESLLPFTDFGQRRFYVVRGDTRAGRMVTYYLIVHRLTAWFCTALIAASVSHILRNE
jgi:hypothetical protein